MHRRHGVGSHQAAALNGLLAGVLLVVSQSNAATSRAASEDVPVPGGIASLAQAIGIAVAPDQARFAAELARVLYGPEERTSSNPKFRRFIAYLKTAEQSESTSNGGGTSGAVAPAERVPIPLPAAVWSEVLRRPVASARLFGAVMSDPAAALLVHGFAALDDETLGFFADHPSVARQLYEDGASAFATFAGHLAVHDNRVTPPGGDQAVPLWEALLGEKATQPGRFIRRLFTQDGGRLAYLYDAIGSADAPRAAFALGLWIPDARIRLARFEALASAVSAILPEWSIEKVPFRRPAHDLTSMLLRVRVTPAGSPAAPAWRTLWARAFDAVDSRDVDRALASLERAELIDAAWLVEILLHGVAPSRSERLDLFAFGQRAFASTDVSALPDALVVLRAFPRVRMLTLTLERIGVRRPAVYAALVRQAELLSDLKGVRARAALAQFQSAIALVERLTRVRTIDGMTAEALLETLSVVPLREGRGYAGALVPWLEFQLRPALGGTGRLDDTLIEALAGAPGTASVEPVSWEGQRYGLDFITWELQRLRRGQARQGRCPIDVALDLHAIAQQLARPSGAAKDVAGVLAGLKRLALPREARETLEKTIDEIAKMRRSPETNQAARVAASLVDLVDVVLGESMLSLNYEVNLDVPRDARWAAADVAARHDFGLAQPEHEQRMRTAWAMPRRAVEDDVPWHVQGAALALDLAIPSLALRRIDTAPLARPPAIAGEYDTFATSVALMDALALRNGDLAAIAEAVARGRRRVDALTGGGGDVNALAREISMDGWRRRALHWNIDHAPRSVGSLFSMTDLLYLGGGGRLDLDAWGMSAGNVTGCLCTRLAAPDLWRALVGRQQPGLLVAAVADVNLRVAVVLAEMQLPARLAKSLLAIAVQDFVDGIQIVHTDDWLARVRTAQGLTRDRIEDYVAVVTVDGPLMPVGNESTSEQVP